jgi:hypothetical protein
MMRTIEILFVIIILSGAFVAASYFAVLPSPQEESPINLRRLALTTLQVLDSDYGLSQATFQTEDTEIWSRLQIALSASLPANIVYNLTVYDINDQGGEIYTQVANLSNVVGTIGTSDVSSYTVASSNVTFNVTPEKIGEANGGTLYILNCSDANGWWITGYTAQNLAQDLYDLLSPYFVNTVMVQNTTQLRQLLDNQTISGESSERVQNAVVINTFGESVPMPSEYYQGNSRASDGYDSSHSSYAKYCFTLGTYTRLYNWTWTSMVGYPFYYVSNTAVFSGSDNSWGIYGMRMTSQAGARAFLEGLNGQTYSYVTTSITDSADRQVTFTQKVADLSNYYGIYPSNSQTSTRALSNNTLSGYNLKVGLCIFNPAGDYLAGAVYNHYATSSSDITGSFLALGLTRTPDIRVTVLSLLSYYEPRVYASEYTATGTSRLVVLQLGLVGDI